MDMERFGLRKGPSMKDVRTKSRKTDTLPPCLQNVVTDDSRPPPSPCPCRHTINFEKSGVFYTKKCRRPHLQNPFCLKNVRTGQIPLPPDCGRLLWTAPNCEIFKWLYCKTRLSHNSLDTFHVVVQIRY